MALNHYLFQELGFRGNTEQYYDARNSYLNEVLDRRTGIPITLSLVYIEVARRAGLDVEGVGLPGHFVVRVQTAARACWSTRSTAACCSPRRTASSGSTGSSAARSSSSPRCCGPAASKDMIERVLRNLKAIHLRDEDTSRALRVVDLLVQVQPGSAEDLRDRGVLYASLDCYAPRRPRPRVLPGAHAAGEGRRGARGARRRAEVQGFTTQLTEEAQS